MSRHREVRRYDYDDYEESDYGSSYPESLPELSASMEKEFLFIRGSSEAEQSISDYIRPSEELDPQEDAPIKDEEEALMVLREANLSEEDRSRLHSCLETIYDVVGLDTMPESRIKECILKCDFDSTLTLNTLLNNPPTVHTEAARIRRMDRVPLRVVRGSTQPEEQKIEDEPLKVHRLTISEEDEGQSPLKVYRLAISEEDGTPVKATSSRVAEETPKTPKNTSVSMRKGPQIDVLSLIAQHRPSGRDPPVNLIVAGHVDSGKSTLIGHLLASLGFVAPKVLHKYEEESRKVGKSSFSYAWILDETPEERARGVTINIGSTAFTTPNSGRSVTILDAPGHWDFIPNMISGTSQADAAVLVVNAGPGEFEVGISPGGQTREHARLLRSFGVSPLIVAINKLDTVDWSQSRYEEVKTQMAALLKSIGYKKTVVSYIPVSGLSGENLISPSEQIKSWNNGPHLPLIEAIENIDSPARLLDKPFRLAVSDVFKAEQSSGLSLAGRVEAGFVLKDDKVLLNPSCELGTVKNLSEPAFAGDFITLNVVGLSEASAVPGCVLSDPRAPLRATKRFKGRIVVFDVSTPLLRGSPLAVHIGSISVAGRLKKLLALTDKTTGEATKKNPRCLPQNCNALVEITVESPICLELYSNIRELGRFLLRSAGKTLAAGLVTEII